MKLFGLDIKRAEPEKRSESMGSWTLPEFGGSASVTESTSLSLSAVWACVRILSTSIAGLPREIKEKKGDGIYSVQHAANKILKLQANSYMSSVTWNELLMADALLHGNHYSIIVRDNSGNPLELLPIRNVDVYLKDGKLVYKTKIDNNDVLFNAEDIFHVKGLSTDGIIGKSVLTTHRENIGLSLSAQKYGKEFYDSDATPRGYLKFPGKVEDGGKSLRESWGKTYGLGKSRTAVLDQGWEYVQMSIAPEDAQYLGTRKFQKTEIATIFGVPPHMIGDLERATFSNIEHQGIEFVKYSLLPWIRRIENEVNLKLLKESQKEKMFCKFNANGLMRGDSAARASYYTMMRNGGILNANEIRALEDLNPIEGGDVYLMPLNMTDINGENGK